MDWKTRVTSKLGPSTDDSVLEELAQHAAATYASARAEGCDAAQADERVAQQIQAWATDPAIRRRRPKRAPVIEPPSGSPSPLAAVLQDTRYAWRLLRRQPAYAALVIATMALGIAATTVLGSVAYGVLLKPLPWADAPRLVRLYENRQGSTRRFRPLMTNAAFIEWRKSHDTLDDLGAWSIETGTVAGTPERLKIAAITPGLLPILGVAPALGRAFAPGEEEPGHAPVMLLSHGLWQQRYAGRPEAIGQTITFETGTPYTIIGVMPAGFAFPDPTIRAWVPFHVRPVVTPGIQGYNILMFQAIGRLRDGVTPAQAAAEGTARGRGVPPHAPVAMAVFGSNGPVEVSAVPLLDALTGDVRPAILILLAAVALLLVTATANVASLQLTRATARRRELAIRSALGAARGRLVRQTLVENLLLGLLGGLAGLALAALMHRALPALLPADFPRLADLRFDVRIQAFAIVVSLVAGLGCGLLPAIAVVARNVVPALVEDSLAPVGGGLRSRTARVRVAIMAGQIAIACVLLVGALLLGRSFAGLLHANVGYDASNVATARIILSDSYPSERKQQIADEIVARLEAVPGVSRAAYSTVMPFAGSASLSSFPLRKRDGSTQTIQTGSRQVSAGYFAALGQRVLEGREFTAQDGTGDGVVIVNREFSRRYLEGRAMGWTLPGSSSRSVPGRPPADRPIIAVVEDTARQSVTDTPEPEIYFPAKQLPWRYDTISVIVRTTGDPRAVIPSLRAVVQSAAPNAPIESLMTMDDRMVATLARPRLYAVLLGTFAAFALAIAGVGLFGVLSYTVALRAREIGVRTALGAQVRDIVGLIVGQSMAIAGAGLAVGLAVSFWLAGALQTFLYGVTPHDGVSFSVVAAVLFAVSVLASVAPARRAAKVDPVKVLRA